MEESILMRHYTVAVYNLNMCRIILNLNISRDIVSSVDRGIVSSVDGDIVSSVDGI